MNIMKNSLNKIKNMSNVNDAIKNVKTDYPLTSQNNSEQNDELKEFTKGSSVDKSSLHILVGIIVIANIFTYSTFKFLNPKGRSQIELALLYVIIYIYTVLYSIVICYMSKWVVRLFEVGMDIKLDNNIELIEKLIKNIFDLAVYTLPFHIFIGILSLTFQKHLIFDHKDDYSWSYQLFSCIISIFVAYMYKNKDISLDAEQIIRYYIIFVTVLSLVKMNVNIDGASTINRFADGIVNLFLNINLKKILIFLPLILMIIGIIMVALRVDIPTIIKYTCMCLFVFLVILLLGGLGTYISKKNGSNVDTEKQLKLPVLKAVSKWFVFMAVYLLPLIVYIATTKKELLSDFSNELLKTFDIHFRIILAFGTIVLFILDKSLRTMDQKQMTRLSSLMILMSILLSKIY